MPPISAGLRYIPGTTDLLVVAPHGPYLRGQYRNDIRTGLIADAIQKLLGCSALLNDRFFKPKGPIQKSLPNYVLDLYRIDHAGKVPGYLDTIREVVDQPGKTLVLWVHGFSDSFAAVQARFHQQAGLFDRAPQDLDALIAFGQGADPKTGDTRDSFSARLRTVETLCENLNQGGMTTLLTHPLASNYRGRDAKRLNQWFLQLNYTHQQVESIDLEIKESGFRDSDENARRTAQIITSAISNILDA